MTDWRHTTTERLRLDQPTPADLDDLHRIHGDPANWSHFPQGRHLDRARTTRTLEDSEVQWDADLGYWCVRTTGEDLVIGLAGCVSQGEVPWWNLYYRFDSAVHGRGYAVEVARHALTAAADVDPARPVVAYLVEHNVASRRTAERLGLTLVWRGPDAGNEDATAIRLVYLDRDPDDELRRAMSALGMPADGMV